MERMKRKLAIALGIATPGDLVEHARRVAVIRDGRVTAELEGTALSEDAVAQQLVLGKRRDQPGDARPGRTAAAGTGGRLFEASISRASARSTACCANSPMRAMR